jgi:hypothetical protein
MHRLPMPATAQNFLFIACLTGSMQAYLTACVGCSAVAIAWYHRSQHSLISLMCAILATVLRRCLLGPYRPVYQQRCGVPEQIGVQLLPAFSRRRTLWTRGSQHLRSGHVCR